VQHLLSRKTDQRPSRGGSGASPPGILIGLSNEPRLKNIYYPTAGHPTRMVEHACEANMPVEIRYGFYGAIIVPQYFDPASFRTCEVCLGRRVLRDSFNTSGQGAFMILHPGGASAAIADIQVDPREQRYWFVDQGADIFFHTPLVRQ